MNQLSPVSDNIVPYCLCVQQRVQGPGLPPFYQWISRCDRCKITWNVRETWYQNLIHQMNITFFLMMFLYIKWEPSSFLSFGYSLTEKLLQKRKKNKTAKWCLSHQFVDSEHHCLSDSPSEAMKFRNSWSSTKGWSLWSWLLLLTDIRLSVLLQS